MKEIIKKQYDSWLSDNQIGYEGVKTISEMLQVNTTLTSLNLSGQEKTKSRKKKQEMMNDLQTTKSEKKEQKHWVKCFR